MIMFKRLQEELALILVFRGSPLLTIVGSVDHRITSLSLISSVPSLSNLGLCQRCTIPFIILSLFSVVRRSDISPSLSLASRERKRPTSPLFFHVPLRLEPIAIPPLFFHFFMLSLGSNIHGLPCYLPHAASSLTSSKLVSKTRTTLHLSTTRPVYL